MIQPQIRDMKAIMIKNFGQINLRNKLASSELNNLLIDGAIIKDWNSIIPMIDPEITKGIDLNNWIMI